MAHEPLWHSPSTNLMLSKDVVHVWRTNLDLPESQIQAFAQTLSPDEHNRADRFYFEKDRRHFIAGRGILRTILGRYLNLEPAQLQFSYSSRGKPALANTDIGEIVAFNLSHSNGLALYAIAQGAPAKPIAHAPYVGIDLEYMRPMPKVEELAKRFFCPREFAVISSLPEEQKQEVFFQAWTCKEAYLKAIGDGLPGLDGVEVSLTPGEPATLLSIQGDQEAASHWSVYQLTPSPGYMAALAVEGQGWNIEYLNFE
ncbi:4'-phosphopantetheinyl transferase family protein [Allocoleopsis sp.]|uniref:4'-phosphopantetheinyl transferase family protein n=1 Tax=Allocoleopsis sp. TaxID=3088169 RepID=UPI002FD12408